MTHASFSSRDVIQNPQKAGVILVQEPHGPLDPHYRLEETCELARAMGLEVVIKDVCPLRKARAATLMGRGWVETVQTWVQEQSLDVVVVDPDISPVQQRNLEKAWACKVLDRTALILEIFAQRARTDAGKLQVRLAQLLYQKSRLIKVWSHLERQRGGAGFLGGPGEKQLELDRRMLEEKILRTHDALEKIRQTRKLHRAARRELPYVALVGYTNAGKSTLFNALTQAQVSADSRLFETLDTTVRRLLLPSKRTVIISDTVGFISQLPVFLRLAFQSTLEEIQGADVLLHVRDVSSPQEAMQRQDVFKVLKDMKCGVPVIEILNKMDRLTPEQQQACEQKYAQGIFISAAQGLHLDRVYKALEKFFHQDSVEGWVRGLCGKGRHWLYEHAHVLEVKNAGEGQEGEEEGQHERHDHEGEQDLRVRIAPEELARLQTLFPQVRWHMAVLPPAP